jgi:putative hydrolase of the HAD superfamily
MKSHSQSSALDGILFDFGGVVVGSPFEAFAEIEAEAAAPAGVIRAINSRNPDGNAWAQLERGEIDLEQFTEMFQAEAAALGSTIDARAVISALIGLPAAEFDARPEVLDAVRRYRRQGLRVGLLTNNITPMGQRAGTVWVVDEFDVVVESCLSGMRKPEPEFYALACAELGTDPSRTGFLDDLGINLKPARALGMHTIKVVGPTAAIAELDRLLG